MILDWDNKITALLEGIDVDPRIYNDSDETKEWVAKFFGFKDFATFQLLPEPKKIIEGLSLDMLPDHKNFELALGKDCIEHINSNFALYSDIDRTAGHIVNFIRFMIDNFQYEVIVVSVRDLVDNTMLEECMDKVETHHEWNELISMGVVVDDIECIEFLDAITPDPDWTLDKARESIYKHADFYLEDIYDYNHHDTVCQSRKPKGVDGDFILDQYMWANFTKTLEDNRLLLYNTCLDYGVGESESYFLSIKFLWSALKKFRSKFFKEMNGKEDKRDYNKTPLRMAIIVLFERIEEIIPDKKYMFSPAAADGELGYFRKQCAWETARYLAEDTGIIFHAKITI